MEASLEDQKPNDNYALEDEEVKVYTPLTRCIKGLKEKHNNIAKVHRERFEQVKSRLRMKVTQPLLTLIRACRCSRIIFITSRALFPSGCSSSNLQWCIDTSHIRPIPFICFLAG